MDIHVITLFPKFFTGPTTTGILGRALTDGHVRLIFYPLADYKEAPNRRVDDVPYGGGAGMLLRPEPVARAIEAAKIAAPEAPVVHFTPRGKRLTQHASEMLKKHHTSLILLCGRYEGIDERVLENFVDYHFCVGDAVLSGGEFPALLLIDAVTRLLPGVLGNDDSPEEESFSKRLGRKKEYPHYTRPEVWRGKSVPETLLSGHHKNIHTWRQDRLT